jgi:hypothetical protein
MMASYYWAKVWIEILYDYKMATLSDHLWRRTIELVLLAKEKNADGYLPKLEEMAFKLQTNPEILEAELTDLANIEIAEHRQDGWYLIASEGDARNRNTTMLTQQRHKAVTRLSRIVTQNRIE